MVETLRLALKKDRASFLKGLLSGFLARLITSTEANIMAVVIYGYLLILGPPIQRCRPVAWWPDGLSRACLLNQ